MLTLIKREIRDHPLFFIGSVILSTVLIGLSIATLEGHYWIELTAFDSPAGAIVSTILVFVFFGMGAVQMDSDRTRKISAFISILSVSRNRILLAKIIAGLLAILIVLVPLAVTVTILLRIHIPPIPIFHVMVLEIFSGTFLITLACYFIGLQAGWNSGRLTPVIMGLILTCILSTLIIIKGFTPEIMVILSLFIVASLIRTWHLFTTTPL
ncbi:MAG: hypothetical protein ACYSTT_09345 [Planctomycetota bacterium]|jgi:hypothetical protein